MAESMPAARVRCADGIGNNFPFIFKPNTTITFRPVARTLTLAGTNANDNTLAAVISDSAAGGVVAIAKTGPGKWILSGSNTQTGDTSIEAGVLSYRNGWL